MVDPVVVGETFRKRLACRGDHVAKTADYICDLERAIHLAEHVFTRAAPETIARLFAEMHVTVPSTVPGKHAIVLGRDHCNNYAVLWCHDGYYDVLVSLTESFANPPLKVAALGLLADEDAEPDVDPRAWGEHAKAAGAEPVDFPVGRGTTSSELLVLHDQAERG